MVKHVLPYHGQRPLKFTDIIPRTVLLLSVMILNVISFNPTEAKPGKQCNDNCFSGKVLKKSSDSSCITYTILVKHNGECEHALSHFNIEIPCGDVTSASNSGGWPMELNNTDPVTGIYGVKVDEIQNFGETIKEDSFTVNYTVCYNSESCRKKIDNDSLKFAYKAATCTFYEKVENLSETALQVSVKTDNPKCANSKDGSIYLEVRGGKKPYSYEWSTGDTTQNIHNLHTGFYKVTIYDANGDSLKKEISLDAPEPIYISDSITPTACNDQTGSINISVNGGTPPYSYSWNTGDTTEDISNLSEGFYKVTITDKHQCTKSRGFIIEENNTLEATLISNPIECYEQGNGEIDVSVSGGTPPYSYQWDNGDTTQDLTNANSGYHTVTITDAKGCTLERTKLISIKRLYITASKNLPSCYNDQDGSIKVSAYNGTEPYLFTWSNGSHDTVRQNLSGGWYTVEVEDDSGCTASKNIYLDEPNPITISDEILINGCGDTANTEATINPVISGGTKPYNFQWSNGDTVKNISVSEEGSYTLTVTDKNGCTASHTIDVSLPDSSLSLSANITHIDCNNSTGAINLNVSGGSEPYTYEWQDGTKSSNIDNLSAGDYSVTIKDANGCIVTDTFTVKDEKKTINASIDESFTQPECGSSDNIITASISGADHVSWIITGDWSITSSNDTSAIYKTGSDSSVSMILSAQNTEGCTAEDTVNLSCIAKDTTDSNNDTTKDTTTDTTDNTNKDDDGIADGDTSDSTITDDEKQNINNCENCFFSNVTNIEQNGSCYKITLEISHNGTCKYALSHFNVQLSCGEVKQVSNSGGWPVEMNTTDPVTGIYGFKVDDISGEFGKGSTTNTITVNYTFCPSDDQCLSDHLDSMEVAYKAGQCIHYGNADNTITYSTSTNQPLKAEVNPYPNPFTDNAKLTFEVNKEVNVKLEVFNLQGDKVLELFNGKAEKDNKYELPLNVDLLNNDYYIYVFTTEELVKKGKLFHISE